MQIFTRVQTSKEAISTISSKGQVTLPVEVRKHLKVKSKDKVAFVIEPNGKVQVAPAKYPNIQSLRGIAGKLKHPLSFRKMRKIAYQERLTKKYGRSF